MIKEAQLSTSSEHLFDQLGTTAGEKFTKEMFDKDPIGTEQKMRDAFAELVPGDLVTWNHTAPGSSGHNITITYIDSDEGFLETIQGQPGEIPKWDDKLIDDLIKQVKSGDEEIRFHSWNFNAFDKSLQEK
jgi:plastocyanin